MAKFEVPPMTAAIFGGTFDPFTVAHRAIVEEVIKQKIADEVIIVPTIVNYHRSPNKVRWLSDKDRVDVINEMMRYSSVTQWSIDTTELLLCNDVPLQVEAAYRKRRRFIDTLLDIRRRYLATNCKKFKVVIGSDEFAQFTKWAEWESILNLANLVVVKREYSNNTTIEYQPMSIPEEFANVSATDIRAHYLEDKTLTSDKARKEKYLKTVCPCTEVLLETPIFKVLRAGIIGSTFKPIQVKSPDWVSILVEHHDSFVVVKQERYGLMRPFMEFPCGMVEKDETPLQAAARELEEETGIKLTYPDKDMLYLGKVPVNPAFMTNYMYYFYVNLDEAPYQNCNQQPDPHEKIIVGMNTIEDLYYRAYNVNHEDSLQTPSLMCTALFLYDNYRKNPDLYKFNQ